MSPRQPRYAPKAQREPSQAERPRDNQARLRQDAAAFTITCAPGLETFAMDEVEDLLTHAGRAGRAPEDRLTLARGSAGEFRFTSTLPMQMLQKRTARLRRADAVYNLESYPIPRPLALLGDQSWRRFIRQIETVLQGYPAGTFKSFALAAAGRESSVMQRIRVQIAGQTGLIDGDTQGDLHIRLRPATGIDEGDKHTSGWETLVRLHPRPLATRQWRVCDYPGALSGPVAAAMLGLLPSASVLFNLCSGSGTLMAEAAATQFTTTIGIENNLEALACARLNLAHAHGVSSALIHADVRKLPLGTGQVNALCADLPFGNLSGTHQANRVLYPALLAEAGRIAASGARFVLITHEIRLLAEILSAQHLWRVSHEYALNLRGLHPRIYVMERS